MNTLLRTVNPMKTNPTLLVTALAAQEAEGAEGLRREVAYSNSAGVAFHSTVEDILLQVAMHGSYHRGQIALLLRQEGAEPAATDFIGFARGVPAATRRTEPCP